MEILAQSPSIFIGLIGWAATCILIWGSIRTDDIQKRALLVLAWGCWMFPAFSALSHQGLLTSEMATQSCGFLTVGIIVLVAATSIKRRTRP